MSFVSYMKNLWIDEQKRIKLVAILLIAAIASSYMPVREMLIDQSTYFRAIISNVTLNLVLLYGIWGFYIDKATKKMSKRKGWAIFFIGIIAITLFFRFVGGYDIRNPFAGGS